MFDHVCFLRFDSKLFYMFSLHFLLLSRLIRHYVEEDDAASVITSEEGMEKIIMKVYKPIKCVFFHLDDCISPGYHTSLPLEVHGAGYSDMQMISKNSYKKLMCPTIIVTQITFDLEAFTYYAVNYLCSINNKKYGFFFDCGCEIVKVNSLCIHFGFIYFSKFHFH